MNRLALLGFLVVVAACGSADTPATDAAPTDLPVLSADEPTLEIGMIDGAEEYLFGQIEAALRLPDGSVVVSDASNARITIYEADGRYRNHWGSEGEGPGEFQNLGRIYLQGDSILASDQWAPYVTTFDLDGNLGGTYARSELNSDSVFTLDAWLHRKFWIDGALSDEDRARTRAALDALPLPEAAPGYRAVRVTRQGDMWIREPVVTGGHRAWVRVGTNGVPDAVIQLPANFDPLDIDGDEVLGRWTGEADVSFVRAYQLASTGRTDVPAWIDGNEAAPVLAGEPLTEEEIRAEIVGSIKNLASHQEIHYARNYSYTDDLTALEDFERNPDLMIDFLVGNARGWAAVFAYPGFDRVCGLAYGFMIPPGWTPGMVVCSPEVASPETTN